jgi:hypothetical protein
VALMSLMTNAAALLTRTFNLPKAETVFAIEF